MPHITDLSLEILLDHLLPTLPLQSLLSLTCTNKYFASVCNDDILWKLKLKREFNYTANADTARESGFKVIYRGLRKPSVFTWGKSGQSRLGLSTMPKGLTAHSSSVPFPAQVDIDARIVALAAGGWSFHALDDQGFLHVWGQLHGETFAMRADGFSEAGKCAKIPHKLHVTAPSDIVSSDSGENKDPIRFTGISTGRAHSAALSSTNQVWVFVNWGRPALLSSDLLNAKLGLEHKVIQVESGWTSVAMLTVTGDVFVIWPTSEADEFPAQYQIKETELDALGNNHPSRARENENRVISCYGVEIPAKPLRLPKIPSDLPALDNGLTDDDRSPAKLIRVAAGDDFLIGLTNKGHVLSIDLRTNGGMAWLKSQMDIGSITWKYLPKYSEIDQIKQHATWNEANAPITPNGPLRITHISAHFRTFVAYSINPSVVLMGDCSHTSNANPTCTIVPSLQSRPVNDPVISVVLGDYHFAALTSLGRVLSWGKYSNGALGLGNPRELDVGAPGGFSRAEEREMSRSGRFNEPTENVTVPTEVKWDWDPRTKGKKFCFAITASGWHTGALAIDLEHNATGTGNQVKSNAAVPGQAGGENDDSVHADAELYEQWSRNQEPYPQPQVVADPGPHQPPGAFPADDLEMYQSPPFNPNPGVGSQRGTSSSFPMPIRPMPGRRGRPIVPGISRGRALPFRVGFPGRGGRYDTSQGGGSGSAAHDE